MKQMLFKMKVVAYPSIKLSSALFIRSFVV